jgi:hypothetical protein
MQPTPLVSLFSVRTPFPEKQVTNHIINKQKRCLSN